MIEITPALGWGLLGLAPLLIYIVLVFRDLDILAATAICVVIGALLSHQSLVSFGAVLLFGSIGAFFLYIPFLHIAGVAVMLLGLALTFSIGAWMGGARVLHLRLNRRTRRLRLRRDAAQDNAARSDETPLDRYYAKIRVILPSDETNAPPPALSVPWDEQSKARHGNMSDRVA